MKLRRILTVSFLLACVSISLLDSAVPAQTKPSWWLNDGICLAGNWEPLIFRVRRGPVPTNYLERYEYEHSREAVLALKAAGANMVVTHFYKGMGMEHEAWDLEYTKKLVKLCHENGMYIGAYIGSTFFNETLYNEVPETKNWIQYNLRGEPINYSSGQYFRDRADVSNPEYREYIKGIVGRAITDYDMDLIHFDNFSSLLQFNGGLNESIRSRFREYLTDKFTEKERWIIFGFSDMSSVVPPKVERNPMLPVYDPLVQEWINFRVDLLEGYISELSAHIRKLNPETVVEINPLGLTGANRAYTHGMYHPRLLAHTDIFWSEDDDHGHYYPDEELLVSKIRSYKLAHRFGNALFSYSNTPLDIAEALAFNRMCIGDVGYRVIENWPQDVDLDDSYRYYYVGRESFTPQAMAENRTLANFFRGNKEMYRDLDVIADVGVMRDYESLTFGGWTPYLNTIQAEQILIQNRVPFTLLHDGDWDNLSDYRVVVLASQENLTDKEIGKLADYARAGGRLILVGDNGSYDERRRERTATDSFEKIFGIAPFDGESDHGTEFGRGRVFRIAGFANHPEVPEIAEELRPRNWNMPLNYPLFMEGLEYCLGDEKISVTVEAGPNIATENYRKGDQVQVHLVNYWKGHRAENIPVIIAVDGFRPKGAVYNTPGQKPQKLDLGRDGNSWSVIVPELDLYGVVVFE